MKFILEGLAAFARRDPEQARADFAAARRADESYTFPTKLITPNHELRELYSSYDLSDVTTVKVAPPASGTIYFDGQSIGFLDCNHQQQEKNNHLSTDPSIYWVTDHILYRMYFHQMFLLCNKLKFCVECCLHQYYFPISFSSTLLMLRAAVVIVASFAQ